MAIVDKQIINSVFQMPRTASPYVSCSTVFEKLDGYEDYSQHYVSFTLINELQSQSRNRTLLARDTNSTTFRSVDQQWSYNQLLLDLVSDEEAYRNVQNNLRNKKSRGKNITRRSALSQSTTSAAATTNMFPQITISTVQNTVVIWLSSPV